MNTAGRWNVRKTLGTVLRVLLTGLFVFFAIRLVEFRDSWVVVREGTPQVVYERPEDPVEFREGFWSLLRRVDKGLYALCVLLYLVPAFLMSVRWHVIMQAAGVSPGLRRAFLISYVGLFFNNFLPGAVGGDIAKAWVTARDEERKLAVVASVILDRLVGLAAMIVLAFAAAMASLGRPELRTPVLLIAGLFGALVVGYFVYFSRRLRTVRAVEWIKARLPLREGIRSLDATFKKVNARRAAVAWSLLLSLLAQSASIVLLWVMSRALGIEQPTLADFFLFAPIAFMLTAIPVTLGTWGTQEVVYRELLGLVRVSATDAIGLSFMFRLSAILVSLPGAIVFLTLRRRSARKWE